MWRWFVSSGFYFLFFIFFYQHCYGSTFSHHGLHTLKGSSLCRLVSFSATPDWGSSIFPKNISEVIKRLGDLQDPRYLNFGEKSKRFNSLSESRRRLKSSQPSDLACLPPPNSKVLQIFQNARSEARMADVHGRTYLTDFEYDILCRKEAQLESLILPTDLPCDNKYLEIYTSDEISYFLKKIRKELNPERIVLNCTALPKGVRMALNYKNGVFRYAFAQICDNKIDVTNFVRSLKDVPHLISEQRNVQITGHLCLDPKHLKKINFTRLSSGKKVWVNTRAALIDILRRSSESNRDLDLKINFYSDEYYLILKDTSKLEFGIESSDDEFLFEEERKKEESVLFKRRNHSFMYQELLKNRFHVIPTRFISHLEVQPSKNSALFLEKSLVELSQQVFPFELEGILIRLKDDEEAALLRLAGAIFKKEPSIQTTDINNISFKVLANGLIQTAVSVNPLKFRERKINKFILGNKYEYENLNIRQGDSIVVITNSNDEQIIHKSLQNSKLPANEFPTLCPRCGTSLTQIDVEGNKVECCPTHFTCTSGSLSELLRFTSPQAFNIPSVTPLVIEELLHRYLISTPVDLFLLTLEDHRSLTNIDLAQFSKILDEIHRAKKVPFERFLYALNLPSITFLMAEEIAYAVGSLDHLMNKQALSSKHFRYADEAALKELTGFLKNPLKRAEVHKMLSAGVVVSEVDPSLSDLCFRDINLYTHENYKEIIMRIKEANTKNHLTDFSYDLLSKVAEKIEKKNSEWKLSRSIERPHRKLVQWKDQQGLIKKTYSTVELKQFCSEFDSGFCVEPKVNGIACTLQYKDGKLQRGLTKHSPTSSYDITAYVMSLPQIPKILETSYTMSIRGELFINEKSFKTINSERARSGKKTYIDSLGALVGTLHRHERDPLVFDTVRFVAYHAAFTDSKLRFPKADNIENFRIFKEDNKLDGGIDNFHMFFETASEALQYATDMEARQRDFGTSIDGMVIKPQNNDGRKEQKNCSFAFKFRTQNLQTKVIGAKFSVGKDGKIFTILALEPVKFENGRTVSQVSITDPSLTFYQGDKVSVAYRGGVVPVLQEILTEKRPKSAQIVNAPTTCPSCSGSLTRKDGGHLFCTNKVCSKPYKMRKLMEFARNLNLQGIEAVQPLIESGKIQDKGDFFKLIPEDIYDQNGISSQASQAFLISIQELKHIKLSVFLKELGVSRIREKDLHKLSNVVSSVSDLKRLKKEDFHKLGLHNKTIFYLNNLIYKNKNLCDALSAAGVTFTKSQVGAFQKEQHEFFKKQNDVYGMLESLEKAIQEQRASGRKLLNFLEFVFDSDKQEASYRAMSMAKWHENKDQKLLDVLGKYRADLEKIIIKNS